MYIFDVYYICNLHIHIGRMLGSPKCAQSIMCIRFLECQLIGARIMLPRTLSLYDSRLELATKEMYTRFARQE